MFCPALNVAFITHLRYSHLSFQAGNVVTGEMIEELILSGADIIKVGIGPGKLIQGEL